MYQPRASLHSPLHTPRLFTQLPTLPPHREEDETQIGNEDAIHYTPETPHPQHTHSRQVSESRGLLPVDQKEKGFGYEATIVGGAWREVDLEELRERHAVLVCESHFGAVVLSN